MTKLHYDAENVLMDLNQGNLYSDLKKAMASSGKADSFTKVMAKKSGIIAYSMDGYETTKEEDITKKLFDQYAERGKRRSRLTGL